MKHLDWLFSAEDLLLVPIKAVAVKPVEPIAARTRSKLV